VITNDVITKIYLQWSNRYCT